MLCSGWWVSNAPMAGIPSRPMRRPVIAPAMPTLTTTQPQWRFRRSLRQGSADNQGVAAALEKAADFLAGVQASDGSFDAPPWQGANASTTGLVGQSMRLAKPHRCCRSGSRLACWASGGLHQCSNRSRGNRPWGHCLRPCWVDCGADYWCRQLELGSTSAHHRSGDPGTSRVRFLQRYVRCWVVGKCSFAHVYPAANRTAKPNGYRHHLRRIAQIGDGRHFCQRRGIGPLPRQEGIRRIVGAWNTAAAGSFLVPASKTARYVEVIARDGGNDSPAVTVLVQARNSSASRRGCQALGAVSITAPVAQRATATFAARAKACASWRLNGKGKWKTVKRGATSVNFAVKSAVGVNWEFRTGRRTVAISVRAPR